MALLTLGTNATSSLSAMAYLHGLGSMVPADVASLEVLIKNDSNPAHPPQYGAFSSAGMLYIPRRGYLQIKAGDYVGVDSQGWPILISANSIANAAWTHS